MVVIRLARGGAKKSPFYRVIVTDKRNPRDGRYIEQLGYYNPVARGQATRLDLKKERLSYWCDQGAQLSPRVATLVKEFDKGMTAAAQRAEPQHQTAKKSAPAEKTPATLEAPSADASGDNAVA